jgi:amino acid transporter
MKPTFLLLFIFPLITFANTETSKSSEFIFDSLKVHVHSQIVKEDSVIKEKLPNHQKIAKTSGILGIVGLGTMLVLGLASIGTMAVLIGFVFSFVAFIMGIYSVRKVKNKKWARLGIILGSLGILVLAAWIGLIVYVVYLFSNGID